MTYFSLLSERKRNFSHTVLSDARLLVKHDNSSNTTAGRKKTAKSDIWWILFSSEVRHLVEKKIDQVSDFAFFETSIKIFYLASAITKNLNGLLDC